MIDQETLQEVYEAAGAEIRLDIMKVPKEIRPMVFNMVTRASMAVAKVAYEGGKNSGK